MATRTNDPRQASFDLNDPVFKEIVAQAVQAALAVKGAGDKSDPARTDAQIVRAFEKAGYKRETIILFDRNRL